MGLERAAHALQVIVFVGRVQLINDIGGNNLGEKSHLSLCISRHSRYELKIKNLRETRLNVR